MTTMTDVRRANEQWFAKGNKRFFGDIGYKLLTAKSGQKYLVRLSSAWSDMFGQPKTYSYFLNPIEADLEIGPLVNKPGTTDPISFKTIEDVKEWLKEESECS